MPAEFPSARPSIASAARGSLVRAIAVLHCSQRASPRPHASGLANVSHELRTPLQQILMFVQLIRLGRTRTESERDRSLEIIERETHRLIALSNSVLAATKAEHQLRSAPVDVANVVQTAADFFAPLAEARKMRIELDIAEPGVRGAIPAHSRYANVLDNAASGPIGPTIRSRAGRRELVRSGRRLGTGDPASDRECRQPFFRVGGTLDDSRVAPGSDWRSCAISRRR